MSAVSFNSDCTEIQALKVLSQYIKAHNGFIPRNPNKLVSYSCSRFDLRTLDYVEAKDIISVYQKNVDRLRTSKKIKYLKSPQPSTSYIVDNKMTRKLKSPRNNVIPYIINDGYGYYSSKIMRSPKPSTSKLRITPKLSLPKYDDISNKDSSDQDTDSSQSHSHSDDNDNNQSQVIEVVAAKNTTKIMSRYNTQSTCYDDDPSTNSTEIIHLYISQHPHNEPPKHPNDLINFSSNRLSYTQAVNIIDKYNKDRYKYNEEINDEKINLKSEVIANGHTQNISQNQHENGGVAIERVECEYNDEQYEDDDIQNDIEHNLKQTVSNKGLKRRISLSFASTLSYRASTGDRTYCQEVMRKCRKTTRLDVIVFLIWLLMMILTLFGVSFGLIHIGFGINTLKESSLITNEICSIYNYTKIECDGDDNINKYRYEYILQSYNKCGNNITLNIRNNDLNEISELTECDINKKVIYDISMNISCYIGDCLNNEYSLIGYQDLTFSAKEDIELGCIVLIVTTVPFVSFVCWVYFCYNCGPKLTSPSSNKSSYH